MRPGLWTRSALGPATVSVSDGGIGVKAVSGDYAETPNRQIVAAGWFYSKDNIAEWKESKNATASVAISENSFGALNVTGAYGDVPQNQDVRAATWNYSRDYYGAWSQSRHSVGELAVSDEHIGIIGTSGTPYGSTEEIAGLDAAGGHFAGGGATPGLCTISDTGPGGIAMSMSHIGFISTVGDPYGGEEGLAGLDAAGFHSAAAGAIPAACFAARQGAGAIAMSETTALIGTVGYGEITPMPDKKVGVWGAVPDGYALWGQSKSGLGLLAQSDHTGVVGLAGGDYSEIAEEVANEPAGAHFIGLRGLPGLCARSSTAAVMGEAEGAGVAGHFMAEEGGVALRAHGQIQSDMVANATVPRKSDSFFMECREVTDKSHVTVTLNNDPGGLSHWVERMPGKGFTVHFSEKTKQPLAFSALVLNPIILNPA